MLSLLQSYIKIIKLLESVMYFTPRFALLFFFSWAAKCSEKISDEVKKDETIKLWCGWKFLKGIMHETLYMVSTRKQNISILFVNHVQDWKNKTTYETLFRCEHGSREIFRCDDKLEREKLYKRTKLMRRLMVWCLLCMEGQNICVYISKL